MPKVILSVPVEIASEDEVSRQVLASLPNKRILVYGANAIDQLTSLLGPSKFHIVELDGALAGHDVVRDLDVSKSGTRFRVTEGEDENEINLAEEAYLTYKSFANFGEFVRHTLNGTVIHGVISGTPDNGEITVSIEFSSGSMTLPYDLVIDGMNLGATPSIMDLENFLSTYGSLTTNDPNSGNGIVDFVIDLNGDTPFLSDESQNNLGTWNRTGYVPPGGYIFPNAIYLDQVSGKLQFVYVAAVPPSSPLAIVTRDAAEETSLFE